MLACSLTWFVCVALLAPGPPDTAPQRAAEREKAEAGRIEDAEALLRELRRRKSEQDVIPPASAANRPARVAVPELLPEGSAVVDRAGTIHQSGPWWIFQPLVGQGEAVSYRLLPNSTLEAMARMHRTAPAPMAFTISGELTVFNGENFLLARSAARALSSSAAGSMPGKAESPGIADSGPPERWDGDSDDVLQAMREVTPQAPAVVDFGGSAPRSAGRSFAPAPLMEGTSMAGRFGRLVRAGDDWAFTFDSDRPDEPDAPLRILPSRSLEYMIEAGPSGASGLRFLVSGEITEFEGHNFLLVRAATRPLETGNLRR